MQMPAAPSTDVDASSEYLHTEPLRRFIDYFVRFNDLFLPNSCNPKEVTL